MARHKNIRQNKNRYQFELSNEVNTSETNQNNNSKINALKNDPVATGQHLTGAFRNDLTNNHASEFGLDYEDHEVKSLNKQVKKQFQETMKQNYNVKSNEENNKKR